MSGAKGRALIDRELYLPRSWTGDGQRLAAAGVPEETVFRTKPQLLELMIERAVAGIPFGWVTADEGNAPLRLPGEYTPDRRTNHVPLSHIASSAS